MILCVGRALIWRFQRKSRKSPVIARPPLEAKTRTDSILRIGCDTGCLTTLTAVANVIWWYFFVNFKLSRHNSHGRLYLHQRPAVCGNYPPFTIYSRFSLETVIATGDHAVPHNKQFESQAVSPPRLSQIFIYIAGLRICPSHTGNKIEQLEIADCTRSLSHLRISGRCVTFVT